MAEYQQIIRLIENKDARGMEELYNDYGSRFYAYCVQRWKLNEDEAWEVVYTTLETLVLKLGNYRFESLPFFEGFLFKVLVNNLRQNFRSKRNKQSSQIEFADLNSENDMPGYISKHISKQAFTEYYKSETVDSPELILLNAALNELDEDDRELLLLRAQNYSYDEIGGLLKIENNQLKVKHHRAKQKLIHILTELKKGQNG